MHKKWKPTPVGFLILIMVLSLLSFVFSVGITRGDNLSLIYFQEAGLDDPLENIGMDMYNSMLFAQNETYLTYSAVYPPLNYVIFGLIAQAVPQTMHQQNDTIDISGSQLTSQTAIMALVYVSIVNILLLLFVVRGLSKVSGWKEALLTACILTAGPVMFALERGNIILFVVGLIGLFLLWNQSEHRFLREIALICLAAAAALKIYPALFGILLLREKRWRDSILTAVYAVLLFFIPFMVMGGFAGAIKYFTVCLKDASGLLSRYSYSGGGSRIDLMNIAQVAIRLLHVIGATISSRTILALLFLATFISQSKWRAMLIVTLLCVLMPPFSHYYTASLYILPIALFIAEDNRRAIDYLYAAFLAMTVCVLPYGTAEFIPKTITNANGVNLTVFVCSLGQLGLVATIFFESIKDAQIILRNRKSKRAYSA